MIPFEGTKPEGVTSGYRRSGDRQVRWEPLPVGKAKSLAELGGQFMYFTPAILYLRIGMSDGPFADFQAELGKSLTFYHHRFDVKLFSGLETPAGNVEWDHVLMAIPDEYALRFLQFMDSVAFVTVDDSIQANTLVRVGIQNLKIEDPLFHDSNMVVPSEIPQIDIVVLGADTSKGMLYMEAGCPAVLAACDPRPETLKWFDDFKAGKNPHTPGDESYRMSFLQSGRKPGEDSDPWKSSLRVPPKQT